MERKKQPQRIILLDEHQLHTAIEGVTKNAYAGTYDLVYIYDSATNIPILLLEGNGVVESFLDKTFNICYCNIYGIALNDSKYPIVLHEKITHNDSDDIQSSHSIELKVTGNFSDAYRYLKNRVTLSGISITKVG